MQPGSVPAYLIGGQDGTRIHTPKQLILSQSSLPIPSLSHILLKYEPLISFVRRFSSALERNPTPCRTAFPTIFSSILRSPRVSAVTNSILHICLRKQQGLSARFLPSYYWLWWTFNLSPYDTSNFVKPVSICYASGWFLFYTQRVSNENWLVDPAGFEPATPSLQG